MTDPQETTRSAPASGPPRGRLPRRWVWMLAVTAALFMAEFVIMCALPRLGLHGMRETVADSLLLAILVLPALYLLAYRPGTLTTPQALRRYTRLEKRTLFTLLALVAVVMAAVIVQGLLMSEHESASRVINVAERQRMLAQHLVEEAMFEAMELAHAKLLEREPRTSGAIAESSARFERGLRALVEGDAQLGIPPCASDEVSRQLKEVEAGWRPLRVLLGQTSQPSDMDEALIYYTGLHDAGDRLLLEVERTITLLEKYYQGRRQRLSTVLAALILPAGLVSALLVIVFLQTIRHRMRMDAALDTERREVEHARAAAEAANKAKSEFLANMSHEIRTPMTAILGFAETLLDPELSESDRVNAINIIRRNGEYLLQIINDILDLSKIEAGRLEVERVRCSPVQVAAEVQSLMQVRADAKKLPFHIEYIGPIPETIETDPGRLRQILINLVGNAIKFTDDGAVRLVVRMRNAECGMRSKRVAVAGTATPRQHRQDAGATTDIPQSPMIQFDVIDTGVGMTAEQMSTLFQAFRQADTSTTRKYGGTGLGLTISKRLAQTLGGDITVDSEPGRGSAFRVTVATGPLDGVRMIDDPSEAALGACGAPGFSPRGAARDKSRGSEAAKLDCRILLAEDGPDNQRLISFVLRKAGAEVTVVENGQLAVDAALAARDEGRPFDVILMDMQMPVLDGYAATSLLRRKGYTGPIIALTAHAMAGDREKCLKVGCDDFAAKPIDRKRLIETVRRYVRKRGAATADSQKRPEVPVS